MVIEVTEIPGFSYWASYFVNGDSSGLDEAERALADEWLERNAPWSPVSIDGEDYFGQYDLTLGSIVDYVCHKVT